MSANVYFDNITKYLLALADQASHSNALGLTNNAVHAESLYAEMLNLIFGWELVNANELNRNQDTYDLIDHQRNVQVQVTTTKAYKTKYDKTVKGLAVSTQKQPNRLVIVYLTKKLPGSIPTADKKGKTEINTYDIERLLEAILFKMTSVKKLRILNEILQSSASPVPIIVSTGHKFTGIAQQALTVRKPGIYIDRPQLINYLFAFTQENNGLLIGGPGYGKSFLLQELQSYYYTQGLGCIIIKINELVEGNDLEIGQELQLDDHWLNTVKALPVLPNQKALVIFDAYDTAKDEKLKSNILRQIRRCLKELHPRCHVLVSVRTYDATRSRQLQELFPQHRVAAPLQCRSLEIPELSQEELDSALTASPTILQIAGHCSPAFQKLLRTPYFLKLFEQIVVDHELHNSTVFSGIETEEQLLEVYWRLTVDAAPGQTFLARKLTLVLAEQESLVCKQSDVLEPALLVAFEQLVSSGVLAIAGIKENHISYTHNILMDFAISKYMLDDDAETLAHYLRTHEKLPFIFRQSFLYHYAQLFRNDRTAFWQHYVCIGTIDEPIFRLLHQATLNYVLASFYLNINDLLPVLQGPRDEIHALRMRKFLEAVRFITKGNLRIKDLAFLEYTVQNMHWVYLWDTGHLLDQAIRTFGQTDQSPYGKMISDSCCSYLEYVLNERLISNRKWWIDKNGGFFGVKNFCRTMAMNIKRGRSLTAQLLGLLNEPDFPIDFFLELSNQMLFLYQADRKAAGAAFRAMYLHKETSDQSTIMGSSVVMTLSSNRKQDYSIVHYRLDQVYTELLQFDFAPAMKMGIQVIKESGGYNHLVGFPGRQHYKFKVGDTGTGLEESFDWFEDSGKRGPEGLLNQIFETLEEEIGRIDGASRFDLNLYSLIRVARSSTVWRRILQLLTAHAQRCSHIIYAVLLNPVFFISDRTRYEAGELLKSVWSYLDRQQRSTLEQVILGLSKVKVLHQRGIAASRTAMMLGSVPQGQLTTDQARFYVANHEPQENYSTNHGSFTVSSYEPSREDRMQRAGFNPDTTDHVQRYERVTRIQHFNEERQKETGQATAAIFRPLWDDVLRLYADAQHWKGEMRVKAEHEVAQFVNLMSCTQGLLLEEQQQIAVICLAYLQDQRYAGESYEPGELTQLHGHYSPNARTVSVYTCRNIINSSEGNEVYLDAIEDILNDNSSVIRQLSAKAVSLFWQYDRVRFWRVTLEHINNESDGLAFGEFLTNLSFDNIIRSDIQLAKLGVETAIARLSEVKEHSGRNLWSLVAAILLKFLIRHDTAFARKVISEYLCQDALANHLIFHIAAMIDPHQAKKHDGKDKPNDDKLFELLAEIANYYFDSILKNGIAGTTAHSELKVIDNVVEELSLITRSGKAKVRDSKLAPATRAAFYWKIKPILELIVARSTEIDTGFMVAHTAYHFMQLLNNVIDEDPENILHMASRIVQYAAKNSFTYDQHTLQEAIQLTEHYIADHKTVLYKKHNFNQLIIILDLFATSGWQDALEVTWQLKDAF